MSFADKAYTDEIRRIEALGFAAWPALEQVVHDGWVLRFAKGYTGRANSVNPITPSTMPLDEKIDFCEKLYAKFGQPCLFRLTPLADADGLASVLEARGYRPARETFVLSKPVDQAATIESGDVTVYGEANAAWMKLLFAATDLSGLEQEVHRDILSKIALPCGYAQGFAGNEGAAAGLAVLSRDRAMILDMATHRDYRRRGHGYRVLEALFDWIAVHGGASAHLQVMADNEPALRLYEAFGFETITYRYAYWRQPG